MEENKANAWSNPSTSVGQSQAVGVTPSEVAKPAKSYPTYLIVVLLVSIFVLLGLVFFLYLNQNSANKATTVVATNSVSSATSLASTSSVSSGGLVSSSTSSKAPYYTYATNVGKYVTFDYPQGGKITVESSRADKTFTKALDISNISITIDSLTFGSSTAFGADECTQYTYDVSKPNTVTYQGPSYNADGTTVKNVKNGTWDISSDKVVIVNKDKGYALIASDKIDGKFLMLDNYNESTGLRSTNGIYKNICNNISITPKGLIQDTTASSYVGHRAYCGASGVSFTEAKKCVEVLDRYITSFKVK
ncbi:MAG: hypothetical protein WCO33_02955 [bacterium]